MFSANHGKNSVDPVSPVLTPRNPTIIKFLQFSQYDQNFLRSNVDFNRNKAPRHMSREWNQHGSKLCPKISLPPTRTPWGKVLAISTPLDEIVWFAVSLPSGVGIRGGQDLLNEGSKSDRGPAIQRVFNSFVYFEILVAEVKGR